MLADQLGRLLWMSYLRPSAPYQAANHFSLFLVSIDSYHDVPLQHPAELAEITLNDIKTEGGMQ